MPTTIVRKLAPAFVLTYGGLGKLIAFIYIIQLALPSVAYSLTIMNHVMSDNNDSDGLFHATTPRLMQFPQRDQANVSTALMAHVLEVR